MKKILFIAAVIATLVGCTKDVEITPSGDNALIITSNISTRVADEQWEKNDAIGVYMTSSTFGDRGANVEYTTDGSGKFTSSTPLYLPSSSDVKILAYYPYDENVSVTAYEIKSTEQVDLLSVIKESAASSSSTVELTFNHHLSKVSLTIKAGDGLETADLDGLVVELSGVSTTASFDLTSNEVNSSSLGEASELILNTTDDGTSSGAIVIPQELTDATLSFTTQKYGTFLATLTTEKFEVGKEYTYAITVNRDNVEVSEANIDPWDKNDENGTADIVDIEYKSDGKYYINSAKGLSAFRDLVNGAVNTTAISAGVTFSTDAKLDIDGVLTRDIDLSTICGATLGDDESAVNWTPIGFSSNDTGSWINYHYTGIFDGGGYEVRNLYISSSSSQQALFRYLGDGGIVYNLGVTGKVTAASATDQLYQTAGVVANNYGFVINCYSEVNVVGETNVGGIAGYNYDTGNVVNCYNLGNVGGTDNNVGGIVGQNGADGYVGYSYSVGKVSLTNTSDPRIGGVVGYNITVDDSDPQIKGSFCLDNTDFSIGQVGENAATGGIDGNVCTEEYLKSELFARIMRYGAYTFNSGSRALSSTEACSWLYNDGGYPLLDFGVEPVGTNPYDIIYKDGTYNIYSGLGLQTFAALVNGGSKPDGAATSGGDENFADLFGTPQSSIKGALMNDIDLNNVSWTPIGSNSSISYKGSFDGEGYLVSGLNVSGWTYAGLFGYMGSGSITNLGVSGNVTGSGSTSSCVGGIVGYAVSDITISNCYNTATITGIYSQSSVGGIFGGCNTSLSIIGCFNSGTITTTAGSTRVGGIGGQFNSYATACYNIGSVTSGGNGSCQVGGIAGYLQNSTLTSCYSSTTTTIYGGGVSCSTPQCYTLSSAADYYIDADGSGSPLSIMNTAAEAITGVEQCFVDNSNETATPTLYWQKTVATE